MPQTSPLNDREVLERIGDEALIAGGVPAHCVKAWKYRGIPWDERRKVRDVARQHRVRLPADFLIERRPPPKPEALRPADDRARAA